MFVQSLQPTIILQHSLLRVLAENTGKLVIKVFNVQGHIIKIISSAINEGLQELMIDMEDLPTGKYVLNAFNGDAFIKSIRFVKE